MTAPAAAGAFPTGCGGVGEGHVAGGSPARRRGPRERCGGRRHRSGGPARASETEREAGAGGVRGLRKRLIAPAVSVGR
ncbi:hypothetical protein PL81_21540 [Streptomyces sp. RSD-27]|nr:hypothetical protein PL81_21540 [Streptomyces sp. RSD-27]